MSRKILITSCLSILFFLAGCSSPKISNIEHRYVENNPGNYQKVERTEIIVETLDRKESNVYTQDFGSDLEVVYYDKDGIWITEEYPGTIEKALKDSKSGMTLVKNKGKGTEITYTAELGKGKTEKRVLNVPYVAEFNKKKIETESDLIKQIESYKSKDVFEWEGSGTQNADEIKVVFKENFTEREVQSHYNPSKDKHEMKVIEIDMQHVYEYEYIYRDGKLKEVGYNEYDKKGHW